jgi:hypothetical protein
MNKKLKIISQHIALLLSIICSLTASANEKKENLPSTLPGAVEHSAMTKRKILTDREQQIVKEAAEAVSKSQKALEAVEKNETKKALGILQEVSGKLDIILAKYPSLELVSADIETDIIEFEGDSDAAKKAINAADDFLDDGKIQEARQILVELVSEMRVTTTSIPLKSFPAAIKEAVAYLSNGKTNEAASAIYDVLNTLVETTEILPLPVLHAEIFLSDAAEIEHRKDLPEKQSQSDVVKLVNAARDQLKLAQLLGYGNKDDYKNLYTAIDDIEETLHSEKSVAVWTIIKQHLAALKNKLTHFKK